MPKRDSAPIGAPCWVDLFTSDPDRARAFYSETFGWMSESAGEEYGGYFNFAKDGIPVAGGMRNDGQAGTPDGWSIYLATDDVERVTKEAVANGGEVVVPAMDVMELGTMAVVTDPGHASIGAWKPGLHKGFGIFAEPGAPSWFELHTRAYDESVQFYQDVFEWTTQVAGDSPEFRYTTLGEEGAEQLAGIMDASAWLPSGAPGVWSVYFGVSNADATLDVITKSGGAVITAAEDTPYGRLAQAAEQIGLLGEDLEENVARTLESGGDVIERIASRWQQREAVNLSPSMLRAVGRRVHISKSFARFEISLHRLEEWRLELESILSDSNTYESI
jgi:predicted enzyme related to lactoylglutathione lyase